MRFGLGIDTGGTYTDAVIYDFEEDQIVSTAKSITVKEDLTLGINGAADQLPADLLGRVKLVSLSTTLATNACVEGKGSRGKLVLIGCTPAIVASYGQEYGLPDSREIIFLAGGHSQDGRILREPDWSFLKSQIDACITGVDVFAVVELWGIRNPEFEKKTKDLIQGWTGMQVVCGHELTGEVNSLKRAASALLNAQLIPIINHFLDAVKTSMQQKGIDAPMVIVRGDGSLMSEEFARGKPVETLLCGPAASVAGGIGLTNEKNCVIVDMGGTTSDIAIVQDGAPKLAIQGASIGKWRTGIHSVLIHTVGLGGDSLIRHNRDNRLTIGPVRAAPLSWAASRWPFLLNKIRTLCEEKRQHTLSLCEFFYRIRDISEDAFYTREEQEIAQALKDGPLGILELAEAAGASLYDLKVRRLEQYGVIMRCSLTPTDIMHLTGEFTGWNREAAHYGALIMAHQIGVSLGELIEMVHEDLKERLYCDIVRMLLEDTDETLAKTGIHPQTEELLKNSYRRKREQQLHPESPRDLMAIQVTTHAALVGIGAPIHIYLPDVAKALDTECIIPEYAGVANAVGAVTGNVVVEETVIIKPEYSVAGITGYMVYTSEGNREFKNYREATAWAENQALELARRTARDRGAEDAEITVSTHRLEADVAPAYQVLDIPAPGTGANGGGAGGAAGGAAGAVARGAVETMTAEAAKPDADARVAGVVATVPKGSGRKVQQIFLETTVTARGAGKVKWA